MNITLKQLQHAQVLAQTGNFGQAAVQLQLSQPALTRSIRALESRLDAPLFDRNRGGVRATAFGEVVLRYGRSMLRDCEDLVHEVAAIRGMEEGHLRVNLGPHPGASLGLAALEAVILDHPRYRITVRTRSWWTIEEQLHSREVDLCLVANVPQMTYANCTIEEMGDLEVVFYTRPEHPLAQKADVRNTELGQYPWVNVAAPQGLLPFLENSSGVAGSLDAGQGLFRPAIEVDDLELAKRLVQCTDGIGAGALSHLQDELRTGQVVLLRTQDPGLQLRLAFIYLSGRQHSPASRVFMDRVREIYQRNLVLENKLRQEFL